ncbi:MAG: response regulator [Desulfobacterales bacterium]|nr:response regulator [Desulfobacterales bacterium]
MKVLIAEDNVVSQNTMKKILEKWGHEVITAKDGREAWQLLQENHIRIVITDWMMPEMDGPTLCRKIRTAKLPNYVYLILLTAKDKKENLVSGFSSGADDFVTKPVNANELRARVKAGERIVKLEENLKKSQAQLLQSEKMASIGQLAAGVAHEINNPTGFVSSNLKTLSDYQNDISTLIKEYRSLSADLKETMATAEYPVPISEQLKRIADLEAEVDIDFVLNDISDLVKESQEGTERIKKIVLDLKDFAHPGEQKLKYADINRNLDSTLNVVWNELKYKATVTKDYGDLPEVQCYPQQLNQVFVNLLVNGAQAIEKQGEINITTRALDGKVEIKISDTGSGIPEGNLSKIFDPFFTTKEVGKGTGLGLNVAYNIIKKHKGVIDVESTLGKGTTFTIRIPTG